MSRLLLSARDLDVFYGAAHVLKRVSFDVNSGEVHAVVGENGAGKSTLLRAIAGFVAPAAGTITAAAPVAWVPQEPELPPDLTITEWIFLGGELSGRFGRLRRDDMERRAAELLSPVGCQASPTARLGALSAVERKQAQLARALRDARDVLMLDEPTAVLGEEETRRLFAVLNEQRRRGAAIVYVSHRLAEVVSIADRVTVLRDGERVSCDPIVAVDVPYLVSKMVGREVAPSRRRSVAVGAEVLRLVDFSCGPVRNVDLVLRRGEILGLAGLVGAGRSELLEGIAGRRPSAGRCEMHGMPVLLPEDRARKGLVFPLNLRENLFLPAQGRWISLKQERHKCSDWIRRLGIRAAGTDSAVAVLSGGNQQRLLLARALRHRSELLLLDEPTSGVDIAAKADIHDHIARMGDAGAAVLLASSDLSELLQLCDRIVALREGRVVGTMNAATASEEGLAALITGAHAS